MDNGKENGNYYFGFRVWGFRKLGVTDWRSIIRIIMVRGLYYRSLILGNDQLNMITAGGLRWRLPRRVTVT